MRYKYHFISYHIYDEISIYCLQMKIIKNIIKKILLNLPLINHLFIKVIYKSICVYKNKNKNKKLYIIIIFF